MLAAAQSVRAKDLKDIGVDIGDLYAAGFSISELSEAFDEWQFRRAELEMDWLWHFHGGCSWWGWFPLVFLAWLSTLACLVVMLVIAIAVVSLAKLIVAVIWPAYIAAGWLRIVAQARRRPSARKCCEPLVQGMKAGLPGGLGQFHADKHLHIEPNLVGKMEVDRTNNSRGFRVRKR